MPAANDFPTHPPAPFESKNSEVVRSIQQRDLLNRWLLLYAAQKSPPAFTEYDPALSAKDRPKLVSYSVSENNDHASILITSYGSQISKAYGRKGLGRELSEYLGPDRAPQVMPIYEECIRRRLPVYTISRIEDRDGRQVDLERLLLPFSDGKHVTNIIGAFETISTDGHFQIQRLIADQTPVDIVRSVIDKDLHFTPPPRISPHHTIEFE
ncbi:MAG: hypothetical protein K2W78_07275 [Xanthobacteraceae bacterium]|nr:hypothetical protein [Xanthobacteraceae bacterium]